MRRNQNHRRLWVRRLEDRTVPTTFNVTNLLDSRPQNPFPAGSLRAAIFAANNNPGADTIEFAAGLTGTITTRFQMLINDAVTINGPGANLLAIDGDNDHRILGIGSSVSACTISGITFAHGLAVDVGNSMLDGAAIFVSTGVGQFNLNGCVFDSNTASLDGGALFCDSVSFSANDCTFINNSAGLVGGAVDVTLGNATFQRCEFSGNFTLEGGAVDLSSNGMALFDSCTLDSNQAIDGGAIKAFPCKSLTLRNCTISGNSSATNGGGILLTGSTPIPLTVQNCTFSANKGTSGGAIQANGPVSIESSILYGDLAASEPELSGPGLFSAVRSLIGSIAGIKFAGDAFTASHIGSDPLLGPLANNGGPRLTHALRAGSLAIDQGSNPMGLATDDRGFARLAGASFDIGAYERQPTTFKVLNAFDSGGGSLRQTMLDAQADPNPFNSITFDSTIFATPRTISLASALPTLTHDLLIVGPGAGLLTVRRAAGAAAQFGVLNFPNGTAAVISDLTVSGGDVAGFGGGIAIGDNADVTLDHVVVSGNKAQLDGGGVYISGTHSHLTLNDCTVANNTATGVGGGIDCENADLWIERSTLSGNTANGGGGVFVGGASASLEMRNATVSGNQSTNAPGGGIRVTANILAEILNSTITNNACNGAGNGGGGIAITSLSSTVFLASTIVSLNVAASAPDISYPNGLILLQNCAIGSASGFTVFDLRGNLPFGANLKLGPLADNGGPTLTHALQTGSPAIDAGVNIASLATDQRGGNFKRVAGAPDIGAFELQNRFLVTNTRDSGAGSLRQAVSDANANPGPDIVEMTNSVFGAITLTSGEIPIGDSVSILPPTFAAVSISGTNPNNPNNASRIFNTQSAPANTAIAIFGLFLTGGKSFGRGGAILAGDENLMLFNCSITGSSATGTTGFGGAVDLQFAGSLTANNCSFNNNSAELGGAIVAESGSKVVLQNCTISGNTAANRAGGGMYVYGSASLLVEGCTFSGNKAKLAGGGLVAGYFTAANTATLRNCTISGNSANDGGGIALVSFNGTLAVQNSTFTANASTTKGGAIERVSGTGAINIDSSILFGDTAPTGPEVFTTGAATVNTSLVQSKLGVTTFTGDAFTNANIGTNPLLGPLANNGGPTMTHAIAAASPAINNGSDPAGFTNDQRGPGFARVVGAAIDIGAFEAQPGPRVTGVLVNAGAAQRSMVTSLSVIFSTIVTLPANLASAFTLTRIGDGAAVTFTAAAATVGGVTVVTLTGFSGWGATAAGSLADGRFTLTAVAAQITANGLQLDGNGDSTNGDNFTFADSGAATGNQLFRLFGDGNGDRVVNAADLTLFRNIFGANTADITFDTNRDGVINAADLTAFRNNFGAVV